MSDTLEDSTCIAFEGTRRLVQGPLGEVRPVVQAAMARGAGRLLVFDAETSRPVEIAPANAPPVGPAPERKGPGRPKLGVVAREVTLLPRHWEWLGGQPGGASVTLRRLVEAARKSAAGVDDLRTVRDNAYRFISAMAGDLPGFEDASRALFRADPEGWLAITAAWPGDIRDHAQALAARSFTATQAA